MNNPAFFPIQSLTFDPDLQIRAKINKETIALYAEQMETEDDMKKFPAVEIYYDGVKYWLADGHHRRAAAEKAGHDKVWAVVKSGTRADALWGAILGNGKQGFGLTRADKQRAIVLAIVEWPDRSNVMLAEAIGCGESTIRRYREQKSTSPNGDVGNLRRVGRDGKSRPAKKKATSKKADKQQKSAEQEQSQTSVSNENTKPDTAESSQKSTCSKPSKSKGLPVFPGEPVGFVPGSEEAEKYSSHTQLAPIPRHRPDVLVRNLMSHFPKEFVPNMVRATFQIYVEIGEEKQANELATEIYDTFGKK